MRIVDDDKIWGTVDAEALEMLITCETSVVVVQGGLTVGRESLVSDLSEIVLKIDDRTLV